jgi:rhodanese-related sulfurtransferase
MPIKPIWESVNELKKGIQNLSVDELLSEIDADPDLLVVDLREIQECVDKGTIPGAKNVPRGMLEFWADPSSPYYRDYFRAERRTVVFCAGGGRSVFAVKSLLDMGFEDVAHLEQGFGGWEKAGQEIEDVASKSRWVRRGEG